MKSIAAVFVSLFNQSHPARGAWIEINSAARLGLEEVVAPRKGCVD